MNPILFHNTVYGLVECYGQTLQQLQTENDQLKTQLTQLQTQLAEALKKTSQEPTNDS